MANQMGPIDLSRLGDYARARHAAISFADYVHRVEANPRLARGAHARMYDAIMAKGVEGSGDNRVFGFFKNDIFGIDDTLRQIVDYFAAAARGMDIRRRVLLLLGPVGSAKSTIVHLMKRGYEEYARTEDGAMYGIVGCPHHEEPLHGLPDELRAALDVPIEGYLCPYCQTVLDEELDGDITRFRVERVSPDENRRIAIATFAPQDPLSQTMDELVGSLDLSKMAKYGAESDARAYRFDGAINVASRGVLELIEILKCVSEDTYIYTDSGIRQMADIVAAHRHLTADTFAAAQDLRVATPDGVRPVRHIYGAGVRSTLRVETRGGYILKGTPLHRVLTVSPDGQFAWSLLRDLPPGAAVVMQHGIEGWGVAPTIDVSRINIGLAGSLTDERHHTPLREQLEMEEVPALYAQSGSVSTVAETMALSLGTLDRHGARHVVGRWREHQIRVPAILTPELSRLLGYGVAEGDLRPSGVWIAVAPEPDTEIRRDIVDIANRLDVPVTLSDDAAVLHGKPVVRLFNELGLEPGTASTRRVPKSILSGSRENAIEFLRGYFSLDGTVNNQGQVIATSPSEALVRDVQALLLNLGIVCRVSPHPVRRQGGVRPHWDVRIADRYADRYAVVVGFSLARMSQKLVGFVGKRQGRSDRIPVAHDHLVALHREMRRVCREQGLRLTRARGYLHLRAWLAGESRPTRIGLEAILAEAHRLGIAAPGIEAMLARDVYYDFVKEVSEVEPEPMWDLEVPGPSAFVSSGFVSHNCKQELLYSLLTLAQERQVKAGRFELFHVDAILIGHTNMAEFERFSADRKNEAIQNRIFVVRVPYNLELDAEIKIYQYMLKGASLSAHIAPGALKAAARWTLLSRYGAPDAKDGKFPPTIRLRLYNRDFKGEYTPANLRELRTLYPNDGMEGISPRQTLNALSMSMARKSVPCVNPIDLLSSLKGTLGSHIGEEMMRHRDVLEANIAKARELYDTESEEEVERAFIYGFDDIAQHLFNAYLENAAASLSQEKIVDPITGEEVDPDLNLLQSIEQEIDIRGEAAREFRREILARVGDLTRRGETFNWQSHARFKEALQKRLFKDVAQIVKITTSTRVPDPDQKKKIDLVTRGLIENGYCEHCAAAILQYVGQRLNR